MIIWQPRCRRNQQEISAWSTFGQQLQTRRHQQGLGGDGKKLSNEIKNIEREISRLKKTGGSGKSQGKRNPTLCPHCKKEGYYVPDVCFELANNKDKRPPGWKIWLWQCGTASKAGLSKYTIDKLLTHTSNFSPTLDIETLISPSIKVPANHTLQQRVLLILKTGINDSGTTDIYFSTDAPVVNIDRSAPKVTVSTATGQTQQSTRTGYLALPHLPLGFPSKGQLMPGFRHTLIWVGPLCDTDCAVTFTREAVIVHYNQGISVLTGWREATGPRLWRIALLPRESNLPSIYNDDKQATLAAYRAYDLPRVSDLIR